jgi:hypothetical protein
MSHMGSAFVKRDGGTFRKYEGPERKAPSTQSDSGIAQNRYSAQTFIYLR